MGTRVRTRLSLQILDPIECSHGIAPGFAIEFVLFESDQYDHLVILLSGEYDRQDTVTFGIESLQLGLLTTDAP